MARKTRKRTIEETIEDEYPKKFAQLQDAMQDQKANDFYKLALELEYVPEDEAELQLYERGQVDVERLRPLKLNHGRFLRLIKQHENYIKPEDTNDLHQVELKRRILRDSGYTHLHGKNRGVSIENAKPTRVLSTFSDTYNRVKKEWK